METNEELFSHSFDQSSKNSVDMQSGNYKPWDIPCGINIGVAIFCLSTFPITVNCHVHSKV